MPKFNPLEASLKIIAIGAIFTTWTKLTIEAFNFAWHIASTSPGEDNYKACVKALCKNCEEIYDDDEERHVIDGVLLCEFCRLKK